MIKNEPKHFAQENPQVEQARPQTEQVKPQVPQPKPIARKPEPPRDKAYVNRAEVTQDSIYSAEAFEASTVHDEPMTVVMEKSMHYARFDPEVEQK